MLSLSGRCFYCASRTLAQLDRLKVRHFALPPDFMNPVSGVSHSEKPSPPSNCIRRGVVWFMMMSRPVHTALVSSLIASFRRASVAGPCENTRRGEGYRRKKQGVSTNCTVKGLLGNPRRIERAWHNAEILFATARSAHTA